MKIDAIKFATSIKVGKRGDQIESVINGDRSQHVCVYDEKSKVFTITDKRDPKNHCNVFPTNVAWFVIEESN